MPVFHSSFNDVEAETALGFSLLPLRDDRLPREEGVKADIVDECIRLFRANVYFRNFQLEGGADRVLVYMTFFIHQCIKAVHKIATKDEAARQLHTLSHSSSFTIPGDAGWPVGGIASEGPAMEREKLRTYLRQCREAATRRLVDRVYNEDGSPNKHWMAFHKRKFMNKEMTS
jgi:actin related protein 2/3 complex subunit 3